MARARESLPSTLAMSPGRERTRGTALRIISGERLISWAVKSCCMFRSETNRFEM